MADPKPSGPSPVNDLPPVQALASPEVATPIALISLPELDKRADSLLLTPELATKLVTALRQGCSRYAAAGLAGVSEGTFRSWLSIANETQQQPYVALLAAVIQAESDFERLRIGEAISRGRDTKDALAILAAHPSHRQLWGKQDESRTVQILIQNGFAQQ